LSQAIFFLQTEAAGLTCHFHIKRADVVRQNVSTAYFDVVL